METIDQISEMYKLLADKTRLTIMALLREKELCVCDIVDIMEMTQPNVSQHLRKLKSGGMVNEQKRGQWVYYSINLEKPNVLASLQQVPSQKHLVDQMLKNKIIEC
ncbi:ArsR family transcriptional regulator [Paenibacillus psychroresistens]|uniref:ArsR family transcriptional regulator n=1 Tax=Paenibacillus psychroresistens TaxID=1778678 RepID=A0A6B8RGR2_9BACL|nr:metalloregulator ArsR/SmtB family transcription factor [Paenibacillus psychroresistens]QGQ94723.1 ArsR family transcriptional regulator [Paenibacillus psychroresistens]